MCFLAQALVLPHHLLSRPRVPWAGRASSAPSLQWCPLCSVRGMAGLEGGMERKVWWKVTVFC